MATKSYFFPCGHFCSLILLLLTILLLLQASLAPPPASPGQNLCWGECSSVPGPISLLPGHKQRAEVGAGAWAGTGGGAGVGAAAAAARSGLGAGTVEAADQKKLCMIMCRKGHKIQKKCVKISKIMLKEVIFTVLRSKARILRRLWTILRRRASECLPLLETLISEKKYENIWPKQTLLVKFYM